MAFFKFRENADEASGAPAQPVSVEAIRQRAKYRLVGATLLVLAGVILFPLLLDSQPRSVTVNTPIDIPDKNKIAPLQIPGASGAVAASVPVAVDGGHGVSKQAEDGASGIITEAASPAKKTGDSEQNKAAAIIESASSATKGVVSEVAKPVKPGIGVASKPAPGGAALAVLAKTSDAARAKALLEGGDSTLLQAKAADGSPAEAKVAQTQTAAAKTSATKVVSAAPAAAEGRFVVQVGAFADTARVQEVRMKVERAGLKTYTNVAETKDGRRIRVRVGPYPTRSEAEKAAARIKKLDLPAALLTL